MKQLAKFLASAIAIATQSAHASGQCEAAYAGAMQNVSRQEWAYFEKDNVFSMHCEKNGSVRASSQGIDASVIANNFPLALKATNSNSYQSLQEFCKEYASFRQVNADSSSFHSEGITANLRSFNDCLALETKQVHVTFRENRPVTISYYIDFEPIHTNLEFRGVNYDPALGTCKVLGADGNGKPVTVDKNFKAFLAKRPLNVICERTGRKVAGGSIQYDTFFVTLLTSEGNYQARLEMEGLNGYELASENKRRQEALEHERDALKAKIAAMNGNMDSPKVVWHQAWTSEGANYGSPGERLGCGGDVTRHARDTCLSAHVIGPTSIHSASGGRCGVNGFVYACVTY